MTNDRTLPEDEAGNSTLRSGDVESEIVDIDGDEDVQFEDAPARPRGVTAADAVIDAEDGVRGEDLAVDTDEDLADEDDYEIVDDEAEELENADDTEDDTPDKGDPEDVVIDDEEQLEEAEAVAAKAKSSRPVKRKVTTAPVKKDKPTPKRTDATGRAVAEHKRTTPALFVRQSVAELKKVIWPNGDTLREYYIVVLAFVIFIITLVSLLDWAFGWVLLKLLGAN